MLYRFVDLSEVVVGEGNACLGVGEVPSRDAPVDERVYVEENTNVMCTRELEGMFLERTEHDGIHLVDHLDTGGSGLGVSLSLLGVGFIDDIVITRTLLE